MQLVVLWGIPVAIERLFMTVYLMEKYSGRDIRSTRGVSIFLAFRLHELRHKHLKKKKKRKINFFCNGIFLSTTALHMKFLLMYGLKTTTTGSLMGMKIDPGVSQLILLPDQITVVSQSVKARVCMFLPSILPTMLSPMILFSFVRYI